MKGSLQRMADRKAWTFSHVDWGIVCFWKISPRTPSAIPFKGESKLSKSSGDGGESVLIVSL